VIRDRGIDSRRLLLAELVGFFGGFAGIWFMLAITGSHLGDIGGPVDWVLAIAIWAAAAVGATIVAYVGLALTNVRARRPAAASAPMRSVPKPA
jgi:hypothetical protein